MNDITALNPTTLPKLDIQGRVNAIVLLDGKLHYRIGHVWITKAPRRNGWIELTAMPKITRHLDKLAEDTDE